MKERVNERLYISPISESKSHELASSIIVINKKKKPRCPFLQKGCGLTCDNPRWTDAVSDI